MSITLWGASLTSGVSKLSEGLMQNKRLLPQSDKGAALLDQKVSCVEAYFDATS